MSAMRAVSDRMSIPDSHDRVKSTIQNDTPNPRNLGLDNTGVCKPGGTAYGRTCCLLYNTLYIPLYILIQYSSN